MRFHAADCGGLTWAKRKRCKSSWLNSGLPEEGCSSSALTDPETTGHKVKTQSSWRSGVSTLGLNSSEIQRFWRADKSTHLAVKVSGVVAIIQPKYDLIWISGSNLWTKWGLTSEWKDKEQWRAGIWKHMKPSFVWFMKGKAFSSGVWLLQKPHRKMELL